MAETRGKTKSGSSAARRASRELPSSSPFTGRTLGDVPKTAPARVPEVVADVAEIQPLWALMPIGERARYLDEVADLVLAEIDELAHLLSSEQGKPLVESYTMELVPSVDAMRWIAREGPEILAERRVPFRQALFAGQSGSETFEPLGVIGVIAPWNYPWSIPFTEVAMALLAGNGAVLKPASLTPLIGERIRETFDRAGLPEGLVRTVHGSGKVGDALVKADTAKIFFTGSVEVGRKVGTECAKRMKGSVLELGGKDPMIVCADANLAHAVSGAAWGAFANAGQTCASIERAYVHESVAEPFLAALINRAEELRLGDPLDWNTEIGPMTSSDQADLVEELIADAVEGGAELRCGGPVDSATLGAPGARFIAPTVLTGVRHEMRIMREEIFGPVLPVMTFEDEAQAVELSNDSDFGLGASVWTDDRERGTRLASELESGTVWLNDHAFTHGACQCAWGGVKSSGLGRTHSRFGFHECVNLKTTTWNPGLARDPWWFPYDETLGRGIRTAAELLYGSGSERRKALKSGLDSLVALGRRTLRR